MRARRLGIPAEGRVVRMRMQPSAHVDTTGVTMRVAARRNIERAASWRSSPAVLHNSLCHLNNNLRLDGTCRSLRGGHNIRDRLILRRSLSLGSGMLGCRSLFSPQAQDSASLVLISTR